MKKKMKKKMKKMEMKMKNNKNNDTNKNKANYKQVIQGLHMVSGTRCPAWSDQLEKWSESRAAGGLIWAS